MASVGLGSNRKWIVFFCLLVFLGGAAVLGSSVWTAVTISSFQNILGSSAGIFVSVYLLIAVGTLMMLVSIIGCLAALFQNKYLLSACAFILIIIFLVELVSSVLAFVFYPVAREAAQRSMRQYDNDSNVMEGWDAIQGVLECCGINAFTDWRQRESFPTLPSSCCSDNVDTCNETSFTRWPLGCDAKIEMFFVVIGSIGFSILVIEIFAIGVLGCGVRRLIE